MAAQRKLAFGLVTAGSLLLIFTLSVYLERPLLPLKHIQFFIQGGSRDSLDSEEPLHWGTQLTPISTSDPDQQEDPPSEQTQTLKTQTLLNAEDDPAGSNKVLNVSESSSKPANGTEKTRTKTGTKAPTPKPQKPTESPFIGDSYLREDVKPQTTCPDSIRNRVANTEFGERFLKTIPVLQWAKHITPEEHQRLSRYSGTHGWGGISYDLLNETLSILNSPANSLMLDDWEKRRNHSECTRCAVVGNGGILNGSMKGAEIDGHDYVFRVNGAIIEGFEQDVGSRTTHYTFSINTLINSLRSYWRAGYKAVPMSKETRYIFLPDHDRDYLMMEAAATHTPVKSGREQGKDATKYFGEDVSVEKLKMYHPDFVRYSRNRFLRSRLLNGRFKYGYRPSTGAAMLLAALHTCDKVTAYGFMTPDYIKYSDHYFDKVYRRVHFYANHDMKLEMVLWQQLNQAGLIQLYMRNLERK
ncbi:alpha-N-acetylgalactosaminide alpha-2,6-sialyltransferase 2 [Halichoeres trimaculatus]|uniref:alpha-N-acetylgalactosaminide alpha-2,6-sialyltransferase 2 n=1 Tax=Halichoeres trimaculatus TaxID=147232 RepID=UPI003D9EE8BC